MPKYVTHCSECGVPLTKNEVAYTQSGSFLSDPINLCEYCAVGYNGDLDVTDLNDFLDEVDFLNSMDDD